MPYFQLVPFFGMVACLFVCSVSRDTKSFLAYSSIRHMMLLLGLLLSRGTFSKGGGHLLMVSHGYVSAALFYVLGEMYRYFGTRVTYFSSSL